MTAAFFDGHAHAQMNNTLPPDLVVNAPAFTQLCRRNRARFLFGLQRLRRGLDPANSVDVELADAIDVEVDRLSHLMRGCQ